MLKMPHKIPVYWKVFKNVNFKHAFESIDTTYTITVRKSNYLVYMYKYFY